jgi:hypothetical protein
VRAVWVSFDATGRACLEATAENFGATVGVEHAEPFVLVRNLERL